MKKLAIDPLKNYIRGGRNYMTTTFTQRLPLPAQSSGGLLLVHKQLDLEWYGDEVELSKLNQVDQPDILIKSGKYYLFDKLMNEFVREVGYFEVGHVAKLGGAGYIKFYYKNQEIYSLLTWHC